MNKAGAPGDFSELVELVRHHVESYDYMVQRGLEVMMDNIKPVKIHHPNTGNTLSHILASVHAFIVYPDLLWSERKFCFIFVFLDL